MSDRHIGPIGRKRLGLQRVVSRHPTHAIERVGQEEHGAFPAEAVWREVRSLYRTGLHPAIALHVRHQGRVVLDRTIGHVSNLPGQPLGAVATPDTLFGLFSATKIVTAVLTLALAEDGVLSIDDPVVKYLPAFGRHGKSNIRIRHLLQHTAGIPDMPSVGDLQTVLARGRIDMEILNDLRPLSPPGERTAYHALTGWFLLQDILELVSGRDLRTLLRHRLLDPLGFKHMHYGTSAELSSQVAQHVVTGFRTPPLMARIFERNIGMAVEDAIALTNDGTFHTAVLPSANVIAPAHEVGRFMELLLRGGALDGVRVLKPQTVHAMTHDITPPRIDGTYRLPMQYGLGVMMGGDWFSLFGFGTKGAFGHLGLSNVVVFADPTRDLSVAFLNTGKPMFAPGMLRWYGVLQRIAWSVPRTRTA